MAQMDLEEHIDADNDGPDMRGKYMQQLVSPWVPSLLVYSWRLTTRSLLCHYSSNV